MASDGVASSAATDLEEARRIVLEGLGSVPARVWLFGSYARGKATPASDIEIGILPAQPLPPGLILELREALEHSRVLPIVDLVDLSEVDPGLRARVEKEGIPWTK